MTIRKVLLCSGSDFLFSDLFVFSLDDTVDELDVSHRCSVGSAKAKLGDPAVAALAISCCRSNLLEECLHDVLVTEESDRLTTCVEIAALAKGYHFFSNRAESLGLAECGADATVLDQAASEVCKERAAVRSNALELCSFTSVSHGKCGVSSGVCRCGIRLATGASILPRSI